MTERKITAPSRAVERWRGLVERLAPSYDVSVPTILAIIHVESVGDPTAHRDGSQYWGLTQVGALAAIDGGLIDDSEYKALRRQLRIAKTLGAEHVKAAHLKLNAWRQSAAKPALDPEAAIKTLLEVIKRYRARTVYAGVSEVEGVAILWKGGAGTANSVKRDLARRVELEQALIDRGIHHLPEYVELARQAFRQYI